MTNFDLIQDNTDTFSFTMKQQKDFDFENDEFDIIDEKIF